MKLLALSLMFLAFNALAVESMICVITTDVDAEKTEFFIDTDHNGNLDRIRLLKTMNSNLVSDEDYPVEAIINVDLVASKREGRDVVVLKAKNFNTTAGGTVTLSILQNAIKNTRLNYNMKLAKVNGKFVLSGPQGQLVNRLHLIGNRVLGQVIGLKEVKASYVAKK